ncbi:hypothetical protein QAD02_001891 [Eretmocerus hayati]|uniref:Uncharacterized protein n=1 Tax=Eretmocerus hayati TaxID=131215 RepID=A0ACC2NK77_9HYME|nr:hypothetical protein QAD02_001891 [Eretmocerus hayati]
MVALICHHHPAVPFLLDHGANVDQLDHYDRNSLHIAVASQSPLYIVSILLKHTPRLDTVCIQDDSYPLGLAVRRNDVPLADMLLAANADVDFAPDSLIGPAILWAVIYNYVEMIQLLIYYKANLEYLDYHGDCLLNICIQYLARVEDHNSAANIEETILVLLHHGALVSDIDLELLITCCSNSVITTLLFKCHISNPTDLFEPILRLVTQISEEAKQHTLLQFVALEYSAISIEYLCHLPIVLQQYYNLCVAEVKQLRLETFNQFTMYDVIFGLEHNLASVGVLELLENLIEQQSFSLYSHIIEIRISEMHRFRSIARKVRKNSRILNPALNIPCVFQQICQYLSVVDLQKLDFVLTSSVGDWPDHAYR